MCEMQILQYLSPATEQDITYLNFLSCKFMRMYQTRILLISGVKRGTKLKRAKCRVCVETDGSDPYKTAPNFTNFTDLQKPGAWGHIRMEMALNTP